MKKDGDKMQYFTLKNSFFKLTDTPRSKFLTFGEGGGKRGGSSRRKYFSISHMRRGVCGEIYVKN